MRRCYQSGEIAACGFRGTVLYPVKRSVFKDHYFIDIDNSIIISENVPETEPFSSAPTIGN